MSKEKGTKKEEVRLPLVNSYIEKWAAETPDALALIQHEDDRSFTYKKFASLVDFFALKLLDMGIGKGDTVATLLVLLPEHIFLMYACFKIGAIIAPLWRPSCRGRTIRRPIWSWEVGSSPTFFRDRPGK